MAFSGSRAPSDCAERSGVIAPVAAPAARSRRRCTGFAPRAPTSSASHSSACDESSSGLRQRHASRRPRREQDARLVGIGEERDRRLGADQDDVAGRPSARRAPGRPDRECARPARGRRRAPCGQLKVWRHARVAPVFAAMRPASSRPSRAAPARRAGSASARPSAARRAACGDRLGRRPARLRRRRHRRAGPSASFHAVSAGRIRVAIWPGGVSAAAIAAAPSAATCLASGEVRTQPETGAATVSMSEVSGAS